MDANAHFYLLGQAMARMEQRVAHTVLSVCGLVETWQPAMADLFGWTEEEAIGQPLVRLIIPPDMQEAHTRGLERWVQARPHGAPVVVCKHFRTVGIHKEGFCVPVYVDVQVVRDDAGVHFLGWVARDIAADASERSDKTSGPTL